VIKIGIIICDRYNTCAGGKCFRSAANREGAFSIYMEYFKNFIKEKYGMKVIFGTHPVPQKYYITHKNMDTWNTEFLSESIKPTITDKLTRLSYD